MMYLRTGTPGAGKTLSTIDEVDARAKKEGRDVYYTNIRDVKLEGWYELKDGQTWSDEIPDNAIYFCDEFYEIFPKLGTTAKRPEHYTLLAKHRHRGLDVYLVCQGTQQIDDFLKPLFENHYHLIRSEMADRSKVFRSQGFISSPHLRSSRKDLETSFYKFNKDLYGKYHSATTNTHIKRVPKIYKQLLVLLFLFACLLGYVFYSFSKKIAPEPVVAESAVPSSDIKSSSIFALNERTAQREAFNPIIAYKPRIANLPETAPAYDELRKPVTYPKANCLMTADRCVCYTQQATLMHNYPDSLCRDFVKNGRFEPTKPDSNSVARQNSFGDHNVLQGYQNDTRPRASMIHTF